MNRIVNFKNIILKSKTFATSLKNKSSKWDNLFDTKTNQRKAMVIGASILGVGLFGFGLKKWDENTSRELKNKSILLTKKSGKFDDVKESVENVKIVTVETEPIVESTPEQHKDETSKTIYMNDSTENVLNGIPKEVPYLIIGAGIAGMSAARTIRANDPLSKVLIINEECQSPGAHNDQYPPYRRVLLSKYIWRRNEESQKTLLDSSGDAKQNSFLFIEPDSFFISPEKLHQCEFGGISLLNGHRVVEINPKESTVTLGKSGQKISYQACLIATGSSPKRHRHLEKSSNTNSDLYESGQVSYFRSLNDFRNLADKIKDLRSKEKQGKVLIIGSGLLGTELTSSLSRVAKDQGNLEIIEVFKEKSHLHNLLPEELSIYLLDHIAKFQTKLFPLSEVVSIEEVKEGPDSGRIAVSIKSLTDEKDNSLNITENVDHVVIAAGVEPNVSLAKYARLETDKDLGGFLVNAELQAREGIYVAGDACSFYDIFLGRRRVEHWNHSEESGIVAGHNMAAHVLKLKTGNYQTLVDNSNVAYDVSKPKVYDYQSSFSFKLNVYNSIEAMGLIDSSLETKAFIVKEFFEDGFDLSEADKPNEDKAVKPVGSHNPLDMPGVVFYLRNKKIVGILLWNCDDDIIIESDFPSPLRSNLARKILSDHRIIESDEDLMGLAADLDLSFYVNSQMKFLDEYTKKRREEEEANKNVQLTQ